MKKEQLVSVVMPTYNRKKILPLSIKSVMDQTYKNWELIIVDDKSVDNTKGLVHKYTKKDKRIKYVLNKHKKGPGGARNQGMILAKGKYIAFLDSDDEWLEHHLRDSIEVLEKEGVNICVALWYERRRGNLIRYNEKKIDKAVRLLKPVIKKNLYFFDHHFCEYIINNPFYCYQTSGLVFKKSILNLIGLMNENLISCQDNDFIFRIFLNFDFCLIRDHHHIWNEWEDSLFNFKDRTIYTDNPKIINKLTFSKIYVIKMYKIRKKVIKKSLKFKHTKSCIKKINKDIGKFCWEIGYINRKANKLKSLYYYLVSMYYDYSLIKLKSISKLFIPGYYKK